MPRERLKKRQKTKKTTIIKRKLQGPAPSFHEEDILFCQDKSALRALIRWTTLLVFPAWTSEKKLQTPQDRKKTPLALLGFSSVAPGCLGISNLMLRPQSKEGTRISPRISRKLQIAAAKESFYSPQMMKWWQGEENEVESEKEVVQEGGIKKSQTALVSVSRSRKNSKTILTFQRCLFKHNGPLGQCEFFISAWNALGFAQESWKSATLLVRFSKDSAAGLTGGP